MKKAQKSNTFAPHTIPSKRRFYLLQARLLEEDSMIEDKDILQVIIAAIKQLFGTTIFDDLNLEVNDIGTNRFIVSLAKEFTVYFRTALTLPITAGKIQNLEIISESSFMQPLINDSRLFFPFLE